VPAHATVDVDGRTIRLRDENPVRWLATGKHQVSVAWDDERETWPVTIEPGVVTELQPGVGVVEGGQNLAPPNRTPAVSSRGQHNREPAQEAKPIQVEGLDYRCLRQGTHDIHVLKVDCNTPDLEIAVMDLAGEPTEAPLAGPGEVTPVLLAAFPTGGLALPAPQVLRDILALSRLPGSGDIGQSLLLLEKGRPVDTQTLQRPYDGRMPADGSTPHVALGISADERSVYFVCHSGCSSLADFAWTLAALPVTPSAAEGRSQEVSSLDRAYYLAGGDNAFCYIWTHRVRLGPRRPEPPAAPLRALVVRSRVPVPGFIPITATSGHTGR
jgi:hypothetical protein